MNTNFKLIQNNFKKAGKKKVRHLKLFGQHFPSMAPSQQTPLEKLQQPHPVGLDVHGQHFFGHKYPLGHLSMYTPRRPRHKYPKKML